MPVFSQAKIRLGLTVTSNPRNPPVDANTGRAPQIWRGADVRIDLGIFDQFGNAVDLQNIDFLEVAIFPMPILNVETDSNFTYNPYSVSPYPSTPAAPLTFVTIPAADITDLVTLQDWQNGTSQQATALFTWVQTQLLDLEGAPTKDFWLAVSGIDGGSRLVYGGTRMAVAESGIRSIYLPNNLAPLIVPLDTTLYIPPNQQMTYSEPIDVDGGTIDIDGTLVQV